MKKIEEKSFKSKKNIFNAFMEKQHIILLFMLFIFSFSYGQLCNASLKVEKGRFIKAIPPSGGYYKMILTNNNNLKDTYYLSSLNINNSCVNNDGSNSANNVELNISFFNSDEQPSNEIVVNPGESVTFLVFVSIPRNTKVERWSCNEVIATSKTCGDYSVKTALQSFVVSPVID